MLAVPVQRLRRSLTTLPDARGWALCGLAAAIAGGLMAAIGFSTGLYALTPTAPGLPLRLLAVVLSALLGDEEDVDDEEDGEAEAAA